MRWKLYCHGVDRENDGRYTAHMSSVGAEPVEVTITAPFEAFDEDEVPRAWHEYRIKLIPVDEKE